MDFDLDLVLAQRSDNPVFYLQYGHARCSRILARAEEAGCPFRGMDHVTDAMLARLTLPEERSLMKKMATLPEVVSRAAEALQPHVVLYFCQELISEFHGYYTKYGKTDRVISEDVEKTQARLALVVALRQTLRSAFEILGVNASDRMDAAAAVEHDES
jgi:arginyl-tRNA synthetase